MDKINLGVDKGSVETERKGRTQRIWEELPGGGWGLDQRRVKSGLAACLFPPQGWESAPPQHDGATYCTW